MASLCRATEAMDEGVDEEDDNNDKVMVRAKGGMVMGGSGTLRTDADEIDEMGKSKVL